MTGPRPTARVARGASEAQDATRTGTDVEQVAHRPFTDEGEQCVLDFLLRHVQGADVVPLMRMLLEVAVGHVLPGALHRSETFAVGGEDRIIGAQQLHEGLCDPVVGQAIEHPAAFWDPVEQARLAEQPEVPGHAGLALTKHLRDFGDRQLALGQDSEQPQPGWFGGGPEGIEEDRV